MLGRKTGMGLIAHDITFWKYQSIYCTLVIFFHLLSWKTLVPLPSERKKKKEIQISRYGGIDEVEKLWLKGTMNPLLGADLLIPLSTHSSKSNTSEYCWSGKI